MNSSKKKTDGDITDIVNLEIIKHKAVPYGTSYIITDEDMKKALRSTRKNYHLGLCDENSKKKCYVSDTGEDYLKGERKREN